MTSRKQTRTTNRAAWVFVALGTVTLAAMAGVAHMGRTVPDSLRKHQEASPLVEQHQSAAEPKQEPIQVKGLIPHYGDTFSPEPQVLTVPPGADAHVFVLNDYLSRLKAVPQEARVNSVTVSDGVATIDFTSALRHGYGTEDEQMLVNGVCTVMGQFKNVNFVKFMVDGQSIDTLGNADLSQPLPVLR